MKQVEPSTRILRSFAEASALQRAWDELVDACEGEVFLTYDWLRIWWTHYNRGRTLMIVVIEMQGELIGLFPLCREQWGRGPFRLTILRTLGTDFTPVAVSLLVRGDNVKLAADGLLRAMDDDVWDLLMLGPSAGKCATSRAFYAYLHDRFSGAAVIERAGEQTYFELAGDWEKQLTRLSSRERNRMRAVARQLSAAKYVLDSDLAAAANLPESINQFIAAHQSSWQARGNSGHFDDWPDARSFHADVAHAQAVLGRLRLLRVTLNDRAIGYKYAFKTGQMYCSYLDARCEDFTGLELDIYRLNFRELFRRGVDEGIRLIDSMRGRYEHKLHLGGKMYANYRLMISAPRMTARWRYVLWRVQASIVHYIYMAIWRKRIMPRLAIRPRPFPDAWIRSNALVWRN